VAEQTLISIAFSVVTDQFKVLKHGNVAGNVYRLMASEAVPLYESPTKGASVMRRMKPGALLVGYSDPGEMRQVSTHDQMFGYIKRSVKLLPVAGLNAEGLYDPEKRAAVEATLPPLAAMGSAHDCEEIRTKRNQKLFMMGFILLIIMGLCSVLLHSPATPVK
jgi:hypothetical protein